MPLPRGLSGEWGQGTAPNPRPSLWWAQSRPDSSPPSWLHPTPHPSFPLSPAASAGGHRSLSLPRQTLGIKWGQK